MRGKKYTMRNVKNKLSGFKKNIVNKISNKITTIKQKAKNIPAKFKQKTLVLGFSIVLGIFGIKVLGARLPAVPKDLPGQIFITLNPEFVNLDLNPESKLLIFWVWFEDFLIPITGISSKLLIEPVAPWKNWNFWFRVILYSLEIIY